REHQLSKRYLKIKGLARVHVSHNRVQKGRQADREHTLAISGEGEKIGADGRVKENDDIVVLASKPQASLYRIKRKNVNIWVQRRAGCERSSLNAPRTNGSTAAKHASCRTTESEKLIIASLIRKNGNTGLRNVERKNAV